MSFLELVGILTLCLLGLFVVVNFILKTIYVWLLAPALGLSVDVRKMGRWAVVTGATDGIGKAFVEALAEKGMDVVLLSRTKSKLDTVAQEIQRTYKVNTKVIAVDFTEGDTIYDMIEKELNGLDIGVLVNNVGIFTSYPDYFLSVPEHRRMYYNMVQGNMVSVLSMCQIVLPGMCEQKRGVIINISSMSGEIPSPLMAVYAATKAFVTKLSEDLASEYKRYGVLVHCLTTGSVATKLNMISQQPTWIGPSPATYVKSALRTVGVQSKTTGYFPHTLLLGTINMMKAVSSTFTYWILTQQVLKYKAINIQRSSDANT